MSESISPQPIAQERLTGQKILRIPKGYREANLADAFSPSGAHDSRKAVIRAFASHGFEVVEEGEFNRDNTLEIAISGSSRRRDREIADRVGIEMPQVFEPDSILTYDKPLVAKMNEADRGQEKYLLEKQIKKQNFSHGCLRHITLPV